MRPKINKNSWHFKFLCIRFNKHYLELQTRSMLHYYSMIVQTALLVLLLGLLLLTICVTVGMVAMTLPDVDLNLQWTLVFKSSWYELIGITILGAIVSVIGIVSLFFSLVAVEKSYDYVKSFIRKKTFNPKNVPEFYSSKD